MGDWASVEVIKDSDRRSPYCLRGRLALIIGCLVENADEIARIRYGEITFGFGDGSRAVKMVLNKTIKMGE